MVQFFYYFKLLYMRSIILIVFILLSATNLTWAKYQLVVAINLSECAACYNSLRHLSTIDKNIELHYVFEEAYRADSADIQSSFGLPERGKFHWSDSLYNSYVSTIGLSTVNMVNEANDARISYLLKQEFDATIAAAFNNLLKEEHIIKFSKDYFSKANHEILYEGASGYFVNELKNSFVRFDWLTGEEGRVISMSDALAQEAFKARYDNDTEWPKHRKIIDELKLPRFQLLKHAQIRGGDIYLTGIYTYFIITNNNQDTGEARFVAVHRFNEFGKLLETRVPVHPSTEFDPIVQEVYLGRYSKDTAFYYFSAPPFHVESDSSLLLGMMSVSTAKYRNKRYFLARFVADATSNKYLFEEFLDYTLPQEYSNLDYDFSNARITPNGKFFALPLADTVYSTRKVLPPIPLNLFASRHLPTSPVDIRADIAAIRHDKEHFYVLYWEDKECKYAKINIKTNKKQVVSLTERFGDNKLYTFANVDCYDYNYVILPTAANELKRVKIF